MVQQLGQFLNLQAGSIEEYQEFLSEVLQAEWESNSDPAVVYPILQRGQHLLDDTFAQLLQQWARNVFSQGKPEEVAGIAVPYTRSDNAYLCQPNANKEQPLRWTPFR